MVQQLELLYRPAANEGWEAAPLFQTAFVGPLRQPSFHEQLNGALGRLSRTGHTVVDVKFVVHGNCYSTLVLYRFRESGPGGDGV